MSLGGFSVRRTGNIGLEILGPNETVIAWTTSEVVGCLIAELLNGFEDAPLLATRMNEMNELVALSSLVG